MKPIAVVAGVTGLTLGGLGLALAVVAKSGPGYAVVDAPIVSSAVPRHPVTPKMEKSVAVEKGKPAPVFALKDTRGRDVRIGDSDRPQFVYFIQDGCPCSVEAEPLFQDLERRYHGKIDFVAVTDAKPEVAYRWVTDMAVTYPVVSRPSADVMHAYSAPASVYSALVTNGRIVKMWPGYSKGILEEMNKQFAAAAGVKVAAFDPKWAPVEKTTGCAFTPAPKKATS